MTETSEASTATTPEEPSADLRSQSTTRSDGTDEHIAGLARRDDVIRRLSADLRELRAQKDREVAVARSETQAVLAQLKAIERERDDAVATTRERTKALHDAEARLARTQVAHQEEVAELVRELHGATRRVEDVYSSETWRAGRIVMFPFHRLKLLGRRLRKQ